MTLSLATSVRLGDLAHDPVILAMPGQEARLAQLDDLLASIPVHGLLQSLKVRVDADGVRYLVTAGSRRLAALMRLRDTGGAIRGEPVTDETPIPVVHSEESDDAAREQAVAENIQRVALTPAAEARQYAELARTASVKEIAARFGVGEKRVNQRLKLAGLHPDVLAALEANDISLAAAEAFTVEADPQKQAKYLQKAEGSSWKLTPSEIRKAFAKKLVAGTEPITALVGREAYLDAGGVIAEDPFDGTEYWADGRLLEELAARHWEGQIAAWEKEGWAFVVEAKAYGQYFYPHNTVTPTELPLGEALAAERAALIERLQALIREYEIDPYVVEESAGAAISFDDLVESLGEHPDELPEPPPEVTAEVRAAAARLAAIHATSLAYTAEQKAGSGVVYWLDGSRAPVLGFIDAKRATPPKEESRRGSSEPKPSLDAIGWDLDGKLRHALFAALREKAIADPLFGLQILVASLHVGVVHGANYAPVGLSVRRDGEVAGQPERGKSFSAALNWAKQQDVSTLAEAAGQLAAHLLVPTYGSDAGTAALVRLLRPEPAKHLDVKGYCKALTVPQLALVWKELGGDGKTPAAKELVKRVLEGIAEKGWLPPQLRTPGYTGPASKKARKGKKPPAAEAEDDDDEFVEDELAAAE